ncbi:CRISPR-associated endonuclease Cas1 [Desulfoferrobacter suflitae]|uniref:CRISPR-associated endonuclease Cas1 n=1 Tax=Desulfoferrobacter suflitae TaxID=2865782 RepID=UPI0021647D5A|nr:CRISPR-associated endonuclease Cas1 [Desulfoferrobacter suflitae]MCK8603810.1 CRISPR-associated endonuclease Cas1 [Desulfoferrobacter suflitae]
MQLVINTPGTFLTQKDECFRLKQQEKTFDISPLKVESIVIANQAMVTTQAVVLALEHNIDVVFLDKYGDPVGRIWFSKLGSTALIRRRQLEAHDSPLGLQLATEMVGQKLNNQLLFLKKLMHARPGSEESIRPAVEAVERSKAGLALETVDLDAARNRIMGLEGTAGRSYFRCLASLLPEKYRFSERSRRPAKDPFNACLNYAYGILYSLVEKACILAGLDPYLGFLHTDNYNKKSMVFDLIEPFRIFGEQTVVYLFTGRKIKDDYFDGGDGAVSLNQAGKPVIVEALNSHLDESVRYRRKNVKRRTIIQHEAHRLANLLLAETGRQRPDWLDIKEL